MIILFSLLGGYIAGLFVVAIAGTAYLYTRPQWAEYSDHYRWHDSTCWLIWISIFWPISFPALTVIGTCVGSVLGGLLFVNWSGAKIGSIINDRNGVIENKNGKL